MEYEWDEAKRQRNLEKHSLDFADLVAFDWPAAEVAEDLRRDYGE